LQERTFMRFIVAVLLLSFLASCSGSGSGHHLSGADSLVINFNNKENNTIINTIHTTESKAIKKIRQFVSGKQAEEYKCGYDGNILFYRANNLLGDISFNYSVEGCRHFIQLIGGKLQSTTMSNEAADFLSSLAQGKNWY
jgi:hypothetical protein